MTIRLAGMIDLKPTNTEIISSKLPKTSSPQRDMFREMLKRTEASLGFKKDNAINKKQLKELIKEEYKALFDDLQKNAEKISKKLEDLRSEMFCDMLKREQIGATFKPKLEKRIQMQTVSELIDVPVNELTLYFLNNVKTQNEHCLIEYHLGHIYFYTN